MTHPAALEPFKATPFGQRRALDLGCGTGLVASVLAEVGWSVVGLDLTEAMLRNSRSNASVIAQAERIPFRSGAFDLIVCRQVLHYVDLKQVLEEFDRIAPLEIRVGQIVAPDPGAARWWGGLFRILSPGRLRVFGAGELARVLDGLSGDWAITTSRFSLRDSFTRNFTHLSVDDHKVAKGWVDRIDKTVATAIDFEGSSYRQDWEICTARRSGPRKKGSLRLRSDDIPQGHSSTETSTGRVVTG